MRRFLMIICALAIAACGGKTEDDNRADAGAPDAGVPAGPVRELTCIGDGVEYPCPAKVYDGFGLPRPPGLEDDKPDAGTDDGDENVDSSSQALGEDAYCAVSQASTSSGGAPPCCWGANYCYVDGGGWGLHVYRCPYNGLFGPGFCFKGTAPTSPTSDNMIDEYYRTKSCVAITVPNEYPITEDGAQICNVSTSFGSIVGSGTRTIKVRPNRGETAFFNTSLGFWSGGYGCGVHRSVLPASSCP